MGRNNGSSSLIKRAEVSFSLGVVGLGRMAQAIIHPLIDKGLYLPQQVFGVVRSYKSVQIVSGKFPAGFKVVSTSDDLASEVWNSQVVILGVKPQQLESIKATYQHPSINDRYKKPLLISILAGITLEKLTEFFPGHACVRVVPNTPCLVEEGLTGISWGEFVSKDQKVQVNTIFEPISEVFTLPENQLDSFLALTSSGPAYISIMAEAIADGAVAAGLPRQIAQYLAHRTLSGTAKLLKDKDLHPAELKDLVTSPGGTTIAAIRHLEMAGFRSALIEAVCLAAERSRQLS